MKKVLKKLCFIAVLLSVFSACESKPTEYEYSVTLHFSDYDNIQKQELITDMIHSIELDNNNIILNKRKIKDLNTNESESFVVSSSVNSVYGLCRFRRMNNNGSPASIEYLKTRIYNLSTDDIQDIKLDYSMSEITEEEFYNLINN